MSIARGNFIAHSLSRKLSIAGPFKASYQSDHSGPEMARATLSHFSGYARGKFVDQFDFSLRPYVNSFSLLNNTLLRRV